ncbi:MAG TPA: Trm112 family protein [Dehalococcoidia bacterium]|nr:Trm112 family protein [Dehalococcoidia bacterium]
MKRDLMDILACPVCKGGLELSVDEENEQEIVTGSLYCPKCAQHYPIVDRIPNLLPPEQRN